MSPIFDNFDLLFKIGGYLSPNDILVLEVLNKTMQQLAKRLLDDLVKTDSYQFLLAEAPTQIRNNVKKYCHYVYKNRSQHQGGFLILGGSFGSFATESYWLADNPHQLTGHTLSTTQQLPYGCFESIGASSVAIHDDTVYSFGGWIENTNAEPITTNLTFGYRIHTAEYTRRHRYYPRDGNDELGDQEEDENDDHFSVFPPLPDPAGRCFASAVNTHHYGKIIITGGCSHPYRNAEVYSSCLVYNLADQSWQLDADEAANEQAATQLTQTPVTSPIYTSSNSSSSSSSTSSSAYLTLPPLPTPRCGHSCLFLPHSNQLLITGGYGGQLTYYNTSELFDFEKQCWYTTTASAASAVSFSPATSSAVSLSSLPVMSVPRSGHVLVQGSDRALYAYGGSQDGILGNTSLERWDMRCSTGWQSLQSMHIGRGYAAGGIGCSEYLYISGGLQGSKFVGGVEVYDRRNNTWQILAGSMVQEEEAGLLAAHQLEEVEGEETATAAAGQIPQATTAAATVEGQGTGQGEGSIIGQGQQQQQSSSEYFLRAAHQMVYVM